MQEVERPRPLKNARDTLCLCAAVFLFFTHATRAMDSEDRAALLESLLDRERTVVEAFLSGDADTYSSSLHENFVLYKSGFRVDRNSAAAMVAGVDCDVDAAWTLSDAALTVLSEHAVVLTYANDLRARCQTQGMTVDLPTPVRASSLWVNTDGNWLAAFHGENRIGPPAAGPMPPSPTAGEPAGDALTAMLMRTETAVWQAWQDHDSARIDELVGDEIAFVNLFGDFYPTREATTGNWTSSFCEVSGFTLADGRAQAIRDDLAILTSQGRAVGTCGSEAMADSPVFATTIYSREADGWKWVFGFNSP